MSFDAWVVGFGFSRVLIDLELTASPMAYGVLLSVAMIDAYLLWLYFRRATSDGMAYSAGALENALVRRK